MVAKQRSDHQAKATANGNIPRNEPYLLLNNSDGCFRTPLSHISYCTSYNSSTQFNLLGGIPIVVSKPIIYYEKILLKYGFLRIHHSTLINSVYLCYISKGEETNELTLVTGEKLIVSRSRKKDVINSIRQWSVEPEFEQQEKPVGGKII
jgi:two-component system, LytTR family, response regulator